MRPSIHPLFRAEVRALLACSVSLFLSACGSAPETPAVAAKKARPTPAAAGADSSNASPLAAHRSVFGTEATLRDPFFPKAKATAQRGNASGTESAGPANFAALLQSGFQGVIGTEQDRLAVVHNVILEPSKKATIVVRQGTKELRIPVRCREISKDTVVLEVAGQGPVRLTQVISQPL